ncbi:hypothetical protein [Duganella callida]|uniref:Uncharacterized protein n=1 Tax=Duganella callida TaxID=2561932 RepID=A0A4Y9S779_9BURK|nr:hypothetical protein [Duganella callida]TFW15934.1 hypothetical protein E4L98_24885 [Duganella callida]
MSNHQALSAALLAAFQLDADSRDPAAIADTAATLLIELATILRGPPVTVANIAGVELVGDETQALMLAELRKQTTLLEVIAKQGDQQIKFFAPASPADVDGDSKAKQQQALISDLNLQDPADREKFMRIAAAASDPVCGAAACGMPG